MIIIPETTFRGRDISGIWHFGSLQESPDNPEAPVYILENDSFFAVLPASVGQSTGLNDINGRPIFEGDTVSFLLRNRRSEGRIFLAPNHTFYIVSDTLTTPLSSAHSIIIWTN